MQTTQVIQKAKQSVQDDVLLWNYELVDDLASLLPADDLSNVNDQTKHCLLSMNEWQLNENLSSETMTAFRETVFRAANFLTHSW